MEPLGRVNLAATQEIYTPLKDSEIRTLTLLPSANPTAPIRCTLEVATALTNNLPPYSALSYVWGRCDDKDEFPTITLCNRSYSVDALCINQYSLSKRSAQVKLMHLIFAGAKQVIAWLGKFGAFEHMLGGVGAEQTKIMFSTIRKSEAHKFKAPWLKNMLRKHSDKLFDPLAELLLREFWTRIWITQEIVNAKKVVVTIGTESVPMQSLVQFLQSLYMLGEAGVKREGIRALALQGLSKTFVHLQCTGRNEPWLNSPSLMTRIILLTSMKSATDLRDKLFGIRNLLPEKMQACIEVDYTKTVGQVFADATRKLIELEDAMDGILWQPANYDRGEICQYYDIPTWAIGIVEEAKMSTSECALGSRFRASGNFPPFYRFEGQELETRGFKVGVVKSTMADCVQSRDKDMAFRFTTVLKRRREWFDETPWPCEAEAVDRQTYVMTILCGGWSWMVERVTRGIFGETADINDLEDRRWGEMLIMLSGRELFTFEPTSAGELDNCQGTSFKYMGLGCNEWVFPGDIICVLLGFKTPVILKPVGDKYEIVGDAYIRMYMNGEVMKGYSGDVEQLERFVIV
ncbi:hypothetical protein QBC44DRAFT_356566 [Cladorrhinum sp. PSN332]|nr:hypothetical protein QBC44DRAFT_356566 [Cladorrhinum sp. PSN332]